MKPLVHLIDFRGDGHGFFCGLRVQKESHWTTEQSEATCPKCLEALKGGGK